MIDPTSTGPGLDILATRGIGVTDSLADVLPPAVRDIFAVLTHVGSVPVLVVLLVVAYWIADRRRGAAALELLFGGFALFLALKRGFALPRPPEALRVVHETGFGFPSAHALDAVVGFGLLALVLDHGRRRDRIALAGAGVVLVGFSRLAIGVHYLVDVLAGAGIGLAYLLVAVRLARWEPIRGLAIAIALSVGALALGDPRGALTLLAAVGVLVGHRTLERRTVDGVTREYGE